VYRNPGLISLHTLCRQLGCGRSFKVIGHDASFLSLLQTGTCMKAAESTSIIASGCELETLPVVKELWAPTARSCRCIGGGITPYGSVHGGENTFEGSTAKTKSTVMSHRHTLYPDVLVRVQDQVEFKHLYHFIKVFIHPSILSYSRPPAFRISLFPVARHMIFSSIQTQNLNLPDTSTHT